jgi:hypothetical protein
MTGANSDQHGVRGNGDVGGGDFEAFPHYLARFEAARPDWGTVSLFTWGTDIQIPSSADYIKDGGDADNTTRLASILRGDHDDQAGDRGTSWSPGEEVDAAFLFLDGPDAAGHRHGFEPGVSGYIDSLEAVDQQIGEILDALVSRPNWEEESWQIVITSDHGGYHNGHGGPSGPEHTIPFLVVGRGAAQGRLPQGTRNVDVVPTVLNHMGIEIPRELTGKYRGADATPPPVADLRRGLVGYYRFEGDLLDSSGRDNHGFAGAESDVSPEVTTDGGKFGGYLSIPDEGGGAESSSYVSLGMPPDFSFGDDDSFTVTTWYRSHGEQSGDPVIVGNKNWVSGGNPGWLLLANEGGGNSFGTNYASGGGERLDLEDIDYNDTGWWFLAAVFDPSGLAVLYCGDAAGTMRWAALDAGPVGPLVSPLPINIGQDGTGSYPSNLDADLDDLAIWRRALSPQEIEALYQEGRGAEVSTVW